MAERKRGRRSRRIRLRRGEALAAGSAIALLVLMFFPWYDLEFNRGLLLKLVGSGRTAWEALDVIAPLLALSSLLVLGLVLARLLRPGWRPAIVPGAATAVLGALAAALVLYRILVTPDLDGLAGLEFEVAPGLAAFLGLAAALGIAVGGYRAMREEGSSFAAVADALQPRRARPASRKR